MRYLIIFLFLFSCNNSDQILIVKCKQPVFGSFRDLILSFDKNSKKIKIYANKWHDINFGWKIKTFNNNKISVIDEDGNVVIKLDRQLKQLTMKGKYTQTLPCEKINKI